MWAGAVCLLGACAAALLAAPVLVFAVCAVALVVALFWRSKARRSDGFGFVPTAFVWAALGVLILSLGATAMHAVMPEVGLQWSHEASIRAGVGTPTQSASPSATLTASPTAVAAMATPAPSAATTAPRTSAAPATVAAPASAPLPGTPAPVAPAGPAPAPAQPVPVVTAPPPAPAPTATPAPTKCSQDLTLGLLPNKNCNG